MADRLALPPPPWTVCLTKTVFELPSLSLTCATGRLTVCSVPSENLKVRLPLSGRFYVGNTSAFVTLVALFAFVALLSDTFWPCRPGSPLSPFGLLDPVGLLHPYLLAIQVVAILVSRRDDNIRHDYPVSWLKSASFKVFIRISFWRFGGGVFHLNSFSLKGYLPPSAFFQTLYRPDRLLSSFL